MKVNVYVTEDVTDEERKKISECLEVRQATRDQLKEFLWTNGKNWRAVMEGTVFVEPSVPDLDSLI